MQLLLQKKKANNEEIDDKEKTNELINRKLRRDDEISLLKALDVEDDELNALLLKIKNMKKKNYIKIKNKKK